MRIGLWLLLIWLLPQLARADEARARELFESGVKAAAEQRWSEAAELLEASLAQTDRPACRYNLIVVSAELERPLEVARHALAFLTTAEARSHVAEVDQVRRYLSRAVQELVILDVQGLPLGVQLRVDGAPPKIADGTRIFVLPGAHRLELWFEDRPLESIEIELAAGTVQPWPRVRKAHTEIAANYLDPLDGSAVEAPASTSGPTLTRATHAAPLSPPARNRALALGLGVSGGTLALVATGLYAYALHSANDLETRDPQESGYLNAADRYSRTLRTIAPFALTGGALLASSVALVEHKPRALLAVSLTSLVLGLGTAVLGTVLALQTPSRLVEGAELVRPTRQAGSMLVGLSLPLLSYGTRLHWLFWRQSPRRR